MVGAVLRAYASGALFGESFGSSEPWVLALHGWARRGSDFAPVLAARSVASGGSGSGMDTGSDGRDPAVDAIALDLPGFGATPPPPRAWGSAEYAERVGAVLAGMAPRVVLVGHSFGGRVAVHLATQHPERVAGVVLTGVPLFRPSGPRPRPDRAYRLVRGFARSGLVGDERLERSRERHGSADYRAASGVVRDVLVTVLGESYEAVLGEISCPVSLVWGEEDHEVPVEVARRAAVAIQHAEVVVLPGIGHMTPIDAPRAIRDALLRLRP